MFSWSSTLRFVVSLRGRVAGPRTYCSQSSGFVASALASVQGVLALLLHVWGGNDAGSGSVDPGWRLRGGSIRCRQVASGR